MPIEHRHHARCGCAGAASAQHAFDGRPFTFPSSTRHYERARPFAIDHLALDIALDVPAKSIRAAATLDVRRVDRSADELSLDAIGFDVRSVSIDDRSVSWRYDGRSLVVAWEAGCDGGRVVVAYRAIPRRGLYFLEPDESYPDRPRQVWSQCQEEDARHWVPCHDSPHLKMTTELTVQVPAGWYALSNGALVSSLKPEGGDWTYHWKMDQPHASYLLMLAAGEFAVVPGEVTVAGRSIPLAYLVPGGRAGDVERSFGRTPDMIRHFSEVTGVPYPWNKYAQVVVADFIFGGMENTTATTMYEHVLLDERASLDVGSDDLVSHELAHQWFGDYVTCRTWYEAWLNEGFATFFEHVWREKHLGKEEYEYGLKVDLDAYLLEAHGRYRRPIVCQDYDAPLDLFDRHLYEKGGLVLHALRIELGDEPFWRGVHAYLTANANGVVETRDLQRALEGVSGQSLGRFFEQWLYKAGHPEIEIELAWDRGILSIGTKQTQSTSDGVPACFDLVIDLDVFDRTGRPARRSVRVMERQQSFALPVSERPSFVVIDPEARIVGEARLKAPGDMLREQLSKAPSARGRWLAAQALGRVDDASTTEALERTLRNEDEFWGTRAEAAAALGRIRTRQSFEALRGASGAAHPKARRAVIEALGNFRTAEAFEVIKPRALRDDSYLVEAEAARALGRTRQTAAFETLVDLLDRPSWFDVVRAGAIDGLAALRDDRAVSHLAARVRYGHSPRARRAAILSMPKIASDRKTREMLEQLLDDSDPIVRIDVARAVGELGDVNARPALRERLELELDARVRRRIREALRDLADPKRGVDQMRDELEKLQTEHSDLKARLAQVEARVEGATGEGARLPRPAARPGAAGKRPGAATPASRGVGNGSTRRRSNAATGERARADESTRTDERTGSRRTGANKKGPRR
ncbi:MAG TPA: HEAT repeat domain-containing protein [Polyangiaceae bacterium]|nr:HEAT repeat domain-containing protein [Polyangiaceae bacterium]